MVRALLYLPDAAGDRLAATRVAGRTLAVRVMVAALRAGASRIAVPSTLGDPAVDRALRRMPALSDALEWLGPGADAPADGPAARWFLLPASALIHASVLDGLLAAPPGRPAVLAESAEGIAPVALLPATPPATLWPNTLWPNTLWKDLAAGRPVGPELARWLRETGAVPRGATGPTSTCATPRAWPARRPRSRPRSPSRPTPAWTGTSTVDAPAGSPPSSSERISPRTT